MLARPDRLVKFLYAATRSLTLDSELDSVAKIADLVGEVGDIGLENIKFITVPWDFYEPDHNRLVWAEDANLLWKRIKHDQPLSRRLSTELVDAARRPGSTATPDPDDESSDESSSDEESEELGDESAEATADEEERAATAAANGLCV
ncbi:hypothetical protein [Nocardioides alcanivorans]|uniref:hypothetical protein n=1 Tax=Nocardioides alcanivorans TaxID=2897352 RepID=UPI001F35E89C|nr:hypothetical protein [Nocardioides alcanivorans]